MRHGDLGESAQQRTEMVRTLSFDCVFCVLFCVFVVLLVQNLNYSLTIALVLPFYLYSG